MTTAAKLLLEQCLALPEEERRYLASELIASVDEPNAEWESAWAEEAARRARAADEAGDQGRPWSDVKAELLGRLASR